MKHILTHILSTFMACIVILFSVLCVLAMVPFALVISFINSIHQGNNA